MVSFVGMYGRHATSACWLFGLHYGLCHHILCNRAEMQKDMVCHSVCAPDGEWAKLCQKYVAVMQCQEQIEVYYAVSNASCVSAGSLTCLKCLPASRVAFAHSCSTCQSLLIAHDVRLPDEQCRHTQQTQRHST
jgi:hypothetical protein